VKGGRKRTKRREGRGGEGGKWGEGVENTVEKISGYGLGTKTNN